MKENKEKYGEVLPSWLVQWMIDDAKQLMGDEFFHRNIFEPRRFRCLLSNFRLLL